ALPGTHPRASPHTGQRHTGQRAIPVSPTRCHPALRSIPWRSARRRPRSRTVSPDSIVLSAKELPVPDSTHAPLVRATLRPVAPGTELRDGLDRILRGQTGALIVLGYNDTVASMCSGGFELDVEFASTRLRELAKMDGAVVVDQHNDRIVRAAVQLIPDASIETSESGTRHRTAERAAKQTGLPVISVSQSMRIVALYVGGQRYVLEDSGAILSRANQALATLERYKE